MKDDPKKVVVLLSGGLDSMLSLAELVAAPVQKIERVHALTFAYNQSSSAEMHCARTLCDAWGVPYTVLDLPIAQTDTTREIPARNLIFIAHAAAFARDLGFNTIALGAEPDSTYTDSSVEFLERAGDLLALFDIGLIAPVKNYENKFALVRRALDLGLPLHLCHSSRSNQVDGKCKTSKLFLDAIEQLFPNRYLSALDILHEMSLLRTTHLSRRIIRVDYNEGRSFKYIAALFSVLGRAEFARDSKAQVDVYSTGSWMHDLQRVLKMMPVTAQVNFHATNSLDELTSQTLNCDSHWARWGIKQAMGTLPRPRYCKYVACRVTQGHLGATLTDLGYSLESPATRTGLLLETQPY